MSDIISRDPEGFLASPFEDRFFRQVASLACYQDDGRQWPAEIVGHQSVNDPDHPVGMPHFTFTQGTTHYDGGLSIKLEGSLPVSYMHSSLSHPHLIIDAGRIPETALRGLEGRPLTAFLALPFAGSWKIGMSRVRQATMVNYADILIHPFD